MTEVTMPIDTPRQKDGLKFTVIGNLIRIGKDGACSMTIEQGVTFMLELVQMIKESKE